MSQAVILVKRASSLVPISKAVVIESAKVEESVQNAMIKIKMPVPKGSTKDPGTRIVDLKRLEHVFTISGFLSAEVGSGNNPVDVERVSGYANVDSSGYTTAKAVKSALFKNILFEPSEIEMYYRDYSDRDYGDTYNGGSATSTTYIKTVLDKVQVTDVASRADDLINTGVKRFAIILNLTRGEIL